MPSVGALLHGLRQARGVSLEEMARVTRVATRYLEALERDDFEALPAPAFTKGFIRAYCQALSEPPEDALACYESQTGSPAPGIPSHINSTRPPMGIERRGRGTVLVSFVLLVVLGLALFAVSLVLQSGREGPAERRADVRPAGQDSARVDDVFAGPSTSPPRAPTSASPVVPDLAAAEPAPLVMSRPPAPLKPDLHAAVGDTTSPYRLVARTSEPTWLRVRTEEGRATEETIPAGEVREWVSNHPFIITVGNAGGVTLELNGRRLPPLGGRGVVISRLVLPPTQP